MDAAAILQEFTTRVSGQIGALLKLVEICVDGGLEATMYETQAQLADAYLERGQAAEARVIAEDLVAREPWDQGHIERFRRALEMLQIPDPDSIIADRLSGQGPFVATDPFLAAESLDGEVSEPILRAYGSDPPAPAPEIDEPENPVEPEPIPEREPDVSDVPVNEPPRPAPPPRRDPEPDIPLRRRTEPRPAAMDINLSDALAELGSAAPAGDTRNLDEVFQDVRSDVAKKAGVQEATEQLALAKTYLDMGMTDEAMAALRNAAKVPTHRYESASTLGRLYLKKKNLQSAVEWLERAAEAPAPNPAEGQQLLYELGVVLEATGEVSRALAVFMELQADAGEYKDVAARVDRLSKVQSGG
jgi:Tfp pilus assembly protein PilF